MYISYRCNICGTEFIMPTEALTYAELEGRYLACPYGHKHIVIIDRYGDLKECMEKANTYKKVQGRVRQVK